LKPNRVIETDPIAGTILNEGATVTLIVAKAPTTVPVPDLTGMTVEEATAALTEAELTLGTTTTAPSDTVESDHIISQSPAANQEVPKDTPVDVVVSTGPGTVVVPDVTCLPFGAAVAKLNQFGLNGVPGGSTTPNPLCPNPNRVALQDPAAGTEVQSGSDVQLFTGEGTSPSGGPTGPTGPTA
jgi:serine/threonine-protein kinase